MSPLIPVQRTSGFRGLTAVFKPLYFEAKENIGGGKAKGEKCT